MKTTAYLWEREGFEELDRDKTNNTKFTKVHACWLSYLWVQMRDKVDYKERKQKNNNKGHQQKKQSSIIHSVFAMALDVLYNW